jgi:hypothetical protein
MTREQKQELKKGKAYRYQRGHWFRKLLVGADNRWSTSKFQALIWTYVVVFGLLALMFAKWMGNSNGWDALLDMETDAWSVYLVLLGGPFAALVLAKLTTSTKADNGTINKTTAPMSTLDPVTGLGQVLGDDAGSPDLGDTQYFVFTWSPCSTSSERSLGTSKRDSRSCWRSSSGSPASRRRPT